MSRQRRVALRAVSALLAVSVGLALTSLARGRIWLDAKIDNRAAAASPMLQICPLPLRALRPECRMGKHVISLPTSPVSFP